MTAPGPPFLELRGIASPSASCGPGRRRPGRAQRRGPCPRGRERRRQVDAHRRSPPASISPTGATILLRGTPVRFGGPADAEASGISVVYQELSLIGDLDVAQNIYLHREPRRGRLFLDPGTLYAQCRELLERLGVHVDPRARVSAAVGGPAPAGGDRQGALPRRRPGVHGRAHRVAHRGRAGATCSRSSTGSARAAPPSSTCRTGWTRSSASRTWSRCSRTAAWCARCPRPPRTTTRWSA